MDTSYVSGDDFVKLVRLEEPPSTGCAEPFQGCAYPDWVQAKVAIIPDLVSIAPEVSDFLSKVYLDDVLQRKLYIRYFIYEESGAHNNSPAYHTGVWFLHNHEDVWADWVPHEVAEKVIETLPKLQEPTILPTPTIRPITVKPLS